MTALSFRNKTLQRKTMNWLCMVICIMIIERKNAQKVKNVTRRETGDTIHFDGSCGGVCTGIEAFVSGGACECTCQYGLVYVMNEGKCTTIDRRKSFVISNTNNPTSRISDITTEDLLSGIKLQYCDISCIQNTGTCQLKREGSQMDKNAWVNLWESDSDVNFSIIKNGNENAIKMTRRDVDYSGLMMRLAISCILPNGEKIDSNVMFSMIGTFQVDAVAAAITSTSPTTISTPTTTISTSTESTTTSTSTSSTATSTPNITSTPVESTSTTLSSSTLSTTSSTSISNISITTISTTNQTDISNTSVKTTKFPTTISMSTVTAKSNPPSMNRSTEAKQHNVSFVPTTKSTNNITKALSKESHKSDVNMLLIIIVPVGFALLVTVLCLTYLCCRCKKKRHAQKRPSDPVSLFQVTTPIFLVNGDTLKAARSFDLPFSMINDPLYELPLDEKKTGTVKHLYAQIDKFLKKRKRSSIDGSLDDGYNTDDNYDYRRFAAFPSELYSFPGSTISLNEDDYKIPEDIDEKNMIIQHNNNNTNESNVSKSNVNNSNVINSNVNKIKNITETKRKSLKEFARSIRRQKEIDLISTEGDEDSTYECPDLYTKYPYKDNTICSTNIKARDSIKKTPINDAEEHPYDVVGVILKDKIFSSTGQEKQNNSLDHESSLDSIYDDPDVIIKNKQREISLKYSKINKKKKLGSSPVKESNVLSTPQKTLESSDPFHIEEIAI